MEAIQEQRRACIEVCFSCHNIVLFKFEDGVKVGRVLATAICPILLILGIQIGQSNQNLILYVDDILIFVFDPEHSLPVLFKVLVTFPHLSGYKVNWQKYKALPLTPLCPRNLFQRGNFSWPCNDIKYLGVTIPPKLAGQSKVNIEPVLNQFFIQSLKDWLLFSYHYEEKPVF